MDEIEKAILNLNNEDQGVREHALDICSKFQTTNFFDWEIWTNLSKYSKPQAVRVYAYATLSVIMKNEWEQLISNTQFFSHFPFYNYETFNNDPIKNVIVNANSTFLLYLAPFEIIIQLFDQANSENIKFVSSLLAEFVSCTYNQYILPTDRKEIVDQFMLICLPKYIQALILHPLSQLKFDSTEYSFYLSLLGKIHHDYIFPLKLISTSEVEEFYASFAPLIWDDSDNISIVWIFDSLFSHDEEQNDGTASKGNDKDDDENAFHATLEPIVISLASNAPNFLQNYGELFFQVAEPTSRYPNLLNWFVARIPIFFGMLEHLSLDSLCPFLEILNEMLQSSSPTIIYEIAENSDELIRSLMKNPEFISDQNYFKYRMNIFESCIKVIAIQIETLPGAPYDDSWDTGSVRSSIFKLANTISEIDTEAIIKELIELITNQDSEDTLLISFIRLLSSSLASAISSSQVELEEAAAQNKKEEEELSEKKDEEQKNEEQEKEENSTKQETNQINETTDKSDKQEQLNTKNIIEISDEAKMATSFLLNIVQSVSRGTSNHIFTLLTKLITFIDFTEEELNEFFPNLLELFISMKPSSFDSFTLYFTSFYTHFSRTGISLSLDRLKSIPPDDPVYYTAATLISKFTGAETTLDSAIHDIDWFINEFNPEEQESVDRLNRYIIQSFDFIGKNPPKSDENEIKYEILSKLVASNNVLMNIINSTQDETVSMKLASPLSHLSNAIVAFSDSFPSIMLSLLESLLPPLFISTSSVVWLKKIALPILEKLSSLVNSENQNEENSTLVLISEYSQHVASNLIHVIEIICADSETPTEIENLAKKAAVILIKFCRFIQNESDNVLIMNIGLKLNDFRCLANVVDISAEKGIQFFALFWEELIQRKEKNCVDKLCEGLYILYDNGKGDLNQFLQLPGVTQQQIAAVEAKIQICGSAKTKRKYIRLLIPP